MSSVKGQLAIAAGLLALMVFLLVMSSRTGQRDFELAKRELDEVEALNVRLDNTIFMLVFELQLDFDQLAQLQSQLRAAAIKLKSVIPGPTENILPNVERKLEVVEAFKSNQAVFRNSRTIAGQLIAELWQHEDADSFAQPLFEVERTLLDFIGRRDEDSGARLRRVLESAAASGSSVVESEEWRSLVLHAEALIDYSSALAAVFASDVFFQLPSVLYEHRQHLAESLSASVVVAGRYRSLLFVVGVVLLVFSALLAARGRRYLQMIEQYNNELEDRVRERTEELASVNAALHAEIAERTHVESQLRIAQKLEAIGQLAAGIAHEINTPTQYVSDNVSFLATIWQELEPVLADYERAALEHGFDAARARDLIQQTNLAFIREEVPSALQQAATGLKHISGIVQAMLNFSHPGVEGMQPADLNVAIESAVTVARNQWKHVAELTLDLDPQLPSVTCNASAVNQAILNLVVNAVHAIESVKPEGGLGRIRIASRSCGSHVEIEVEDDGPGVPKQIRHRIFDLFFTTKEVGKGTGQGLAIAHRVIHQMHGGTLTYEPAEAGGARFVIRLPAVPPALADKLPVPYHEVVPA